MKGTGQCFAALSGWSRRRAIQLAAIALVAFVDPLTSSLGARQRRGGEMYELRKESRLYTLYQPFKLFPRYRSWLGRENLVIGDELHNAIVHVHQDLKTGVPRHVFFELNNNAPEKPLTLLHLELFADGAFTQRGLRHAPSGTTALLPDELALLTPYVQAALKRFKGMRLRYEAPADPTDLTTRLTRPDIAFEVLSYLFVAGANGETGQGPKSIPFQDLYVGLGRKYFETKYFFGEWLKELLRRKMVVSVPDAENKGTLPIKLGEHGRELLEKIKRVKQNKNTPAQRRKFGALLVDTEKDYQETREWVTVFDQTKNRDLIRRIQDYHNRGQVDLRNKSARAAVNLAMLIEDELPSGRWSGADEIRKRVEWFRKKNLVQLYGPHGEQGIVLTSAGRDVLKDH